DIGRAMTDGNELYEVTVLPNGKSQLTQIDETKLPPVPPGVEAPLDNTRSSSVNTAATATAPIVVDVMVVYTPASRNRHGQSGLEAKILQAVADANTAYQSSLVNIQLNLVYMGEVSYTETGDMGQALSATSKAPATV